MKTSSFTSTSTHNSCPRRYYFRYLAVKETQCPTQLERLVRAKNLMAHRELVGHIAHELMAKLVRKIAVDGINSRETALLEQSAIQEYREIFARSKRAGVNTFCPEGMQIAEHFNGCANEISDEDTIIELHHFLLKGQQHLALLGVCQGDFIEAEVEDSFRSNRGIFRVKVDLVLHRKEKTIIVDWKTRSHIGGQDIHQVRAYLEWARRCRNVAPTDLIGILASLRSGAMAKVQFDPLLDDALTEPPDLEPVVKKEGKIPRGLEMTLQDRYPASPARETCGSCPFATVCRDKMEG